MIISTGRTQAMKHALQDLEGDIESLMNHTEEHKLHQIQNGRVVKDDTLIKDVVAVGLENLTGKKTSLPQEALNLNWNDDMQVNGTVTTVYPLDSDANTDQQIGSATLDVADLEISKNAKETASKYITDNEKN